MDSPYKIQLATSVDRYYKKLPQDLQHRIDGQLEALAHNPFQFERLGGQLKNLYKIRIGVLRMVFSVDRDRRIVTIVRLGPRGQIYKI